MSHQSLAALLMPLGWLVLLLLVVYPLIKLLDHFIPDGKIKRFLFKARW